MYHKLYPITPSQQATNGALSIFVVGCQKDNVSQQLIGLSVLSSATLEQVNAAMLSVQNSLHVTRAYIEGLLVR